MPTPRNHQWGKSPAQDRVWGQIAGMAPSRATGRLLMVLNFQAFIDESFSKEEFVLGGHIATVEAWANFAREWEELLPLGTRAKNGRYHFKMSEMAQSQERMARVPTFYKLIENHVITSISCRINLPEFVRAQERIHEMAARMNWVIRFNIWTNPYFVTFRMLLDKFHLERKQFESRLPLDRKIDFYFDDRTEKEPILKAWDEHLQMKEDKIREYYGATPRFENDQDFLPLQGADLWAWWVRDWYEEDATELPDKMRDFDFGVWKGKKRPNIVMSANEDQIVDVLQSVAVESFAEGHLDPLSLARLKGDV